MKKIPMHIDLKNFAVYTTAKARDYAAMRMVRGAYRGVGAGLDEAYVVLPRTYASIQVPNLVALQPVLVVVVSCCGMRWERNGMALRQHLYIKGHCFLL